METVSTTGNFIFTQLLMKSKNIDNTLVGGYRIYLDRSGMKELIDNMIRESEANDAKGPWDL